MPWKHPWNGRGTTGRKNWFFWGRVVKLDAMHAFSETSLWNANTWGRVGTCMGTIVRSCRCRIHADEFYAFHGRDRFQIILFLLIFIAILAIFQFFSPLLNVKNTLLLHFNYVLISERILIINKEWRKAILLYCFRSCRKIVKKMKILILSKNWYWKIFDGWYSWYLRMSRTLASRFKGTQHPVGTKH